MHPTYCLKSEVSIMLRCQLYDTQHFESGTVRKAPLPSPHTERNGAACPSYIDYRLDEKLSIHYASLLAMFNLLQSSMNQELFKKHLC